MINYYVLWQKNNQMLHWYLEKYFDLIKTKLLQVIDKDLSNQILNNKDHKSFLMNWDISSMINRLLIIWDENEIEYKSILEKLLNQINIFLNQGYQNCISSSWSHIWKTDIKLTTLDYNPYNVFDAHPEHKNTGWILWWWEKTEKEWLELYTKTFDLLKKVDEWFYDELNTIIQKIIPLGTSKHLHNSASYKECIWHLYMWYTLDVDQPELSNLEAIIHESSHNKLNLLFHFDKLILNSLEENYYSPFRPDARHLKGVFLAIHAFVPTIYVLMTAYKNWFIKQENWLHKIVLYYIKNKITYKVLRKYAVFSELWEEVMKEVKYVMDLTDITFKSLNINKEIINNAILLEKEHFNNVNQKYPNFKY